MLVFTIIFLSFNDMNLNNKVTYLEQEIEAIKLVNRNLVNCCKDKDVDNVDINEVAHILEVKNNRKRR